LLIKHWAGLYKHRLTFPIIQKIGKSIYLTQSKKTLLNQ